mmetsp:Transcript_20659/g.26126  ORF Transcript_20659/g.26126 Transcript_20659/m.26126 type:complete len:272 (+) Transcript_20659:452-1267(+)
MRNGPKSLDSCLSDILFVVFWLTALCKNKTRADNKALFFAGWLSTSLLKYSRSFSSFPESSEKEVSGSKFSKEITGPTSLNSITNSSAATYGSVFFLIPCSRSSPRVCKSSHSTTEHNNQRFSRAPDKTLIHLPICFGTSFLSYEDSLKDFVSLKSNCATCTDCSYRGNTGIVFLDAPFPDEELVREICHSKYEVDSLVDPRRLDPVAFNLDLALGDASESPSALLVIPAEELLRRLRKLPRFFNGSTSLGFTGEESGDTGGSLGDTSPFL